MVIACAVGSGSWLRKDGLACVRRALLESHRAAATGIVSLNAGRAKLQLSQGLHQMSFFACYTCTYSMQRTIKPRLVSPAPLVVRIELDVGVLTEHERQEHERQEHERQEHERQEHERQEHERQEHAQA